MVENGGMKMKSDRGSLPIDKKYFVDSGVGFESVTTIPILNDVFGISVHYEGKPNPEIMALQSIEYQEDYSPVFCDKCECETVVYKKYDDWDEETTIICAKDYEKLPKRPELLDKLIAERKECLKREREAGIVHYQFDFMKEIEIPKLEFKLPEER